MSSDSVENLKDSKNKRVVVTGLGVVSSIGIGWPEFWKNLVAGKSGISEIEAFDTSNYDRHRGGEIKNFCPEDFIPAKKIKYLGRTAQLAIAAAQLAVDDAAIDLAKIPKRRIGVMMGTTMGEPQVMEAANERALSQSSKIEYDCLSSLKYPAATIAQNVARYFDCRGKNLVFTTACAAGNYSIARGCQLIQSGKLDVVIAGGADALSRIAFTGFGRLFAMAPEKCQPFDKNRKGMILGEGAGIVILESMESAQKRKAKLYAHVKGAGFSCDAKHMTNPSVEGVSKAILKSLQHAEVSKKEIDYICAHGTGTVENDKAESGAINKIFNKPLEQPPVSSIKSILGHTMGAASAIETISCCLALQKTIIPPTINVEQQDEECKVFCVSNNKMEIELNAVLNNSQAFGGNNACIILTDI